MYVALQVVTVLLVAVAFALALAHALELPGKLRLSREQYLAVQRMYYPGFTVGGLAEPLSLFALASLMLLTSTASMAFWLIAGAFVALLAMHAAYWVFTHPVNRLWVRDVEPTAAGSSFFSTGAGAPGGGRREWRSLRDHWEYSHVVRAAFGLIGLVSLATGIAS